MKFTEEHILSEIVRTAQANGGVSLGRDRFFQETGIKDSDWQGKYWSRWGDAVKAAGFAANQLQGAYESDALLAHVARLCRELGKFPVTAEMRLKRRADTTFPNDRVFERFGSRDDLRAAVAEFCRDKSEFVDVLPLCGAQTAVPEHADPSEQATTTDIAFVYLLRSGRFYKIGRSNAVGRRERELAIQLPDKSNVVHSIKTDDPAGIEDYWHRRFQDRRKNGEWFALTSSDIAAFRRRKFM